MLITTRIMNILYFSFTSSLRRTLIEPTVNYIVIQTKLLDLCLAGIK